MKTLWSLEPFHQTSGSVKFTHQLLQQLTDPKSNIEIGFVVTRSEPELYMAYDVPARQRFTVYPRKLLKEVLRKANVSVDDKYIHLIDFNTISNTAAVDRLMALANSRGIELVALYTHANKGYKRFILGSFAETMIHRSKKSILLINPKTVVAKKIQNILFASDFGPATNKYLKRCIQICRQTNSNLTVFHVAEVMNRWYLNESDPKIHLYRKKLQKLCQWIEQECKASKIPCEVIVTTENKPITDLVLHAADSAKADLIAVVAKTGRLSALMGGSTTRQLIRASHKPILVFK